MMLFLLLNIILILHNGPTFSCSLSLLCLLILSLSHKQQKMKRIFLIIKCIKKYFFYSKKYFIFVEW